MTQAPAGWYPQSDGSYRYWNGSAWTEAVRVPAMPPPVGQPYAHPSEPHLPLDESGRPPHDSWAARHKVLTALLAIAALLVALSTIGGTDPAPKPVADQRLSTGSVRPSSSPPTTSTTKVPSARASSGQVAPPPSKPKVPGIGTPVRDGRFEFRVTKVETGLKRVGGAIFHESAQGQFVLIHITVKNIGSEPQTLSDSSQTVLDAQRREFSSNSYAAMLLDNNDVFFEEINPGNTVTGTLVYDMPKGSVPASIELHDSSFSDGVTVSLR